MKREGFSKYLDQSATLADAAQPYKSRMLAALGLTSRARDPRGHRFEIPALEFGDCTMVLLPGESFVEYQLLAQRLRPEAFVMAIGYGECSPGYIPTDRAFQEDFIALNGDWCWVSPEAEGLMTAALKTLLARKGLRVEG